MLTRFDAPTYLPCDVGGVVPAFRRRLFSVKIWMTAVTSDDEDTADAENFFYCSPPPTRKVAPSTRLYRENSTQPRKCTSVAKSAYSTGLSLAPPPSSSAPRWSAQRKTRRRHQCASCGAGGRKKRTASQWRDDVIPLVDENNNRVDSIHGGDDDGLEESEVALGDDTGNVVEEAEESNAGEVVDDIVDDVIDEEATVAMLTKNQLEVDTNHDSDGYRADIDAAHVCHPSDSIGGSGGRLVQCRVTKPFDSSGGSSCGSRCSDGEWKLEWPNHENNRLSESGIDLEEDDRHLEWQSDSDRSTEGTSSPDLGVECDPLQRQASRPPSDSITLNVNAPAFTSSSSMTPVIITKNVDIGSERWKPHATVVEETVRQLSTVAIQQATEQMPQPFIGADGLYYIPTEFLNGHTFTQPSQSVQIQMEPVMQQMNGVGVPPSAAAAVAVSAAAPPSSVSVSASGATTSGAESDSTPVPAAEKAPSELTPKELKQMLQLQFEYYFSKENLTADSYLVSQMDSDQYVPISTVAKFNQIKKLTSDMDVIMEALRESPYIQLDEENQKIRGNMKRCIVILREIPQDTPIEEVKALFEHELCPAWTSFEFAHNDSWYITFDDEDKAKRAYRHLREVVQTFQDRPIMARIKAKTLLSRSVFTPRRSQAGAQQPSDAYKPVTAVSGAADQPVSSSEQQVPLPPPPPPLLAGPPHTSAPLGFPTVGPVFAQPPSPVQLPQGFQYYTPIQPNPMIHLPWVAGAAAAAAAAANSIRPNHFVHQDNRQKGFKHNNFIHNKGTGGIRNSYFGYNNNNNNNAGKPRFNNTSNNYFNGPNKVPYRERNGFSSDRANGSDDKQQIRRSLSSNGSGSYTNNNSDGNGNAAGFVRDKQDNAASTDGGRRDGNLSDSRRDRDAAVDSRRDRDAALDSRRDRDAGGGDRRGERDQPNHHRGSNSGNGGKDKRSLDEIPRFQRLKKYDDAQGPRKPPTGGANTANAKGKALAGSSGGKPTTGQGAEAMLTSSTESMNLALENFPALPAPVSPSDIANQACSLKELASNALRMTTELNAVNRTDYLDVSTGSSSSSGASTLLLSEAYPEIQRERLFVSSPSVESHLSSGSTSGETSVCSTTNAHTPKMSYAQMAQAHKSEQAQLMACNFGVFDIEPLPCYAPNHAPNEPLVDAIGRAEAEKNAAAPRSSSPRPQRKAQNVSKPAATLTFKSDPDSMSGSNEQDGDTPIMDTETSFPLMLPAAMPEPADSFKETYASKSGKLPVTMKKSNGAPQQPRPVARTNSSQKAAATASNLVPKPLMATLVSKPADAADAAPKLELTFAANDVAERSPTFSDKVRANLTATDTAKYKPPVSGIPTSSSHCTGDATSPAFQFMSTPSPQGDSPPFEIGQTTAHEVSQLVDELKEKAVENEKTVASDK